MGDIKAIETVYRNLRLRSRLEARWCVFFDNILVEYKYEKDGYDLGKYGWYLPDFWLPHFNCWLEVKPCKPTDNEKNKAIALCDKTGYPVIVTRGAPKDCWDMIYATDLYDGGGFGWTDCTFVFNEHTDSAKLLILDYRDTRRFYTNDYALLPNVLVAAEVNQDDFIAETHTILSIAKTGISISLDAAISARQARFEHGERG